MERKYYQPVVDEKSPCVYCPNRRECIACSYLAPSYNQNRKKSALNLRKWWASHVKRMKQPETDAMRRGSEIHERLNREHGVTRNLDEVFEALSRPGGSIKWSARLCSRLDGIRGQPDWVESTRVALDRITHQIVEWKSHPPQHRKPFSQAVGYALILSYPRMIADGIYFYDHISTKQSFSVDIDFEFRFYDFGTPWSHKFVRDWKFIQQGEDGSWPDGTPYGAEFVFGVKRSIKKFSGLGRVRNISEIPRCGYCPPLDSPKSTLNGGTEQPDDLCFVWNLCRSDLLAPKTKQRRLTSMYRKRQTW